MSKTSKEAALKPTFDEVSAVTRDDATAAFVGELRAAGDRLLEARGKGDLKIYEDVQRDEQVFATFEQLRTSIIAREYSVVAGGEAPIDVEAADYLRAELAELGFDAVCKKMLFGALIGYSVSELMLAPDAARVRLLEIKVRKAKRFRFDADGGLRLVTKSQPQGKAMPAAKFWVFTCGAEDDDEMYGRALAEKLYWLVWFKRNATRFYSLWLEKFASPTPVAKVPPGSNEEQRQKWLSLLRSIQVGGRLVIPNNIAVELLQAASNSGGEYNAFLRYLDSGIAKVILCQTMTTDSGASLSQAEVHEGVQLNVVKSWADMLCESFNRTVARWITQWNFPGAKTPKVWRDCQQPEDLDKRAERDTKIYGLGYQPTQDYIDRTYGEGWVPRAAAPAPTFGTVGIDPTKGADAPAFAEGEVPVTGDDIVRSAIGEDDWRAVIGPEVEAITKLLDGATTLDEVRDRLGELAKRDNAALIDSTARIMFAGHIAGQVGVELDGHD